MGDEGGHSLRAAQPRHATASCSCCCTLYPSPQLGGGRNVGPRSVTILGPASPVARCRHEAVFHRDEARHGSARGGQRGGSTEAGHGGLAPHRSCSVWVEEEGAGRFTRHGYWSGRSSSGGCNGRRAWSLISTITRHHGRRGHVAWGCREGHRGGSADTRATHVVRRGNGRRGGWLGWGELRTVLLLREA